MPVCLSGVKMVYATGGPGLLKALETEDARADHSIIQIRYMLAKLTKCI